MQHVPLAQSVPAPQACPDASRHVCAAVQAWVTLVQSRATLHATHVFCWPSLSESQTGVGPVHMVAFVAVHVTHVCEVVLHAGFVPEQFASVRHCTQAAAVWPVPSHTPPGQGTPGAALPHVPVLHVAHTPLQALLQQIPFTHSFDAHWSTAVHVLPVAAFARHLPALGPESAQYMPIGSAQSVSSVHVALHAVMLAQPRFPAQAVGVPGAQVPAPLHVLVVSMPPAHASVPHPVPLGKEHVPVTLQSVAPHAPPVGLHVAAQQWVPGPPSPIVPHWPLVHWSVAVHTAPAACFGTHLPLAPGFAQ